MSQGMPRRPLSDQDETQYGDVFDVRGNLASETIAPGDAACMQFAESQVLRKTQRGGPGAVMQSAATPKVRTGVVDPDDVSDVDKDQGVTVTEAKIGGTRVITERVRGEIAGQCVDPRVPTTFGAGAGSSFGITIDEDLEATAYDAAGDKPVDQSDAAAIKAAEVRALRSNQTPSGGIGAPAQSADDFNARTMLDENKTTLSDGLADATANLPRDKDVTREDAEGVIRAEIGIKPDTRTTPGGVAASMSVAARINQNP